MTDVISSNAPVAAKLDEVAALGERAECVMLNKGPYIVEAVRVLDDILQRMENQVKNVRCSGTYDSPIDFPINNPAARPLQTHRC